MGGSHFDMIEKRRVVPDLAAVDPRLRPLLLDMLEPDPKDRPESMAAVAAWRPRQSVACDVRALPAGRVHVQARGTRGVRSNWKSATGRLAVLALTLLPGGPASELPSARIIRFVNTFDGGDCFFVAPVAVSEREAILDGYSSDGFLAPFQALDTQFHHDFGFSAFIGVHQVTPAQCSAVNFLHRAGKQQAVTLRLEVDDAKLADTVPLSAPLPASAPVMSISS
jgi:serine/threonine-protein kinase